MSVRPSLLLVPLARELGNYMKVIEKARRAVGVPSDLSNAAFVPFAMEWLSQRGATLIQHAGKNWRVRCGRVHAQGRLPVAVAKVVVAVAKAGGTGG